MDGRNLTLLTDLYQLTMMQGYYLQAEKQPMAVFDLFHRRNPYGSAFAIAAGLDLAIDYILNLRFSPEDMQYLESLNIFQAEFLDYLANFHFSGDIKAVPEGSIILPNEPILQVIAPICEAQLVETALLNIINHQSLIATKAARVKWAAGEDEVMEFGLRRAQGPDAGFYGARACVIAGCSSTSNLLAGKEFNIPVKGTHAHSWIMTFPSEKEAFRTYANLYPNSCILLVDTYNTLKSGVPNAIAVFDEMKAAGKMPTFYGIRLDSGDLSYLSKKARKMLDEAGYPDAIISASSDLDEYLISDLKLQGAKISLWGVGTNLITAKENPSFGGVYKLSAIEENGEFIPKIKLSDNIEKVTNPGVKKILRVYDKETGKMKADLLALADEQYDLNDELELFDPSDTWKRMNLEGGSYELREMLVPIFEKGQLVYERPDVFTIKAYCDREKETIWEESKRLHFPQKLYMDLSLPLYNLKKQLIEEAIRL
ncbi:nicotinate phosphoribosyltransferase [Clostridiales bacterium COT073_COT-073]|nr:nicotinate phosphoribosyltransferase [Clostridiales bacterium COT073_COT-073]